MAIARYLGIRARHARSGGCLFFAHSRLCKTKVSTSFFGSRFFWFFARIPVFIHFLNEIQRLPRFFSDGIRCVTMFGGFWCQSKRGSTDATTAISTNGGGLFSAAIRVLGLPESRLRGSIFLSEVGRAAPVDQRLPDLVRMGGSQFRRLVPTRCVVRQSWRGDPGLRSLELAEKDGCK